MTLGRTCTSRSHKRGMILIPVIFLMAIVLGLLSVMALTSGQLYRERKLSHLKSLARAMADSGVAYVRANPRRAPATQPGETVELNARPLLPAGLNGSLVVTYSPASESTCRVTARVVSASREVEDSVDVDLAASALAPRP